MSRGVLMFEVLGRVRKSKARFSRYIVRFSTPWPRGARSVYLVSSFTSLFPGRLELIVLGDRGFRDVLLWDGLYPYWFSVNGLGAFLDPENDVIVEPRLLDPPFPLNASLAEVGVEDYIAASKGLRGWGDLVVHDEDDAVFLSRLGRYTVVRLWAPRGVIDGVILEFNDSGGVRSAPMALVGRGRFKEYYEVWVEGSLESYRFKLLDGGKELFYGLDGLGDYRMIKPSKVRGYDTVKWWVGSLFYMVFVDSFDRTSLDKGVKLIEKFEPRERGYYGGDLEGLARRLDYVKGLNVNAIYLTPIYVAGSYHRYDVIDHMDVDPILGGIEAFRKLLVRARGENLKIIVELVAHHASPCSKAFLEELQLSSSDGGMFKFIDNLESAPHEVREAFKGYIGGGCRSLPQALSKVKPFYESFYGSWAMPKLNHENARTRKYIKDVMERWLREGVDGFRVDVGHAIPDDALLEYYNHLKSIRGEALMALEVSYGLEHYPLGYTADSATNYDLREAIIRFTITRDINASGLEDFIAEQYSKIPIFSFLSLINMLGSHDTPRIKTLAKACAPTCLKQAYTLLFTLPGSPAIYYGDEVGMEGGGDPDCRRPMIWDESKWDKGLLEFIGNLAKLREEVKALRLGALQVKAVDDDTILVKRLAEDESAYILVCRGGETTLEVKGRRGVKVLIGHLSNHKISTRDGIAVLKLSGKGGVV
ncbi:MAG: alpha-amylase family glycosyl hydrolase [Thermoprotei archaeon]|nr:alpha-amylase family glycosyl hydrolase [Thermoprotei archaeon]